MLWRAVTVAVAAMLAGVPFDPGTQLGGLDRALIEEALSLGASGEVRPYELKESGHVNGAVYTPFVRVAFAARAASLRGEVLEGVGPP